MIVHSVVVHPMLLDPPFHTHTLVSVKHGVMLSREDMLGERKKKKKSNFKIWK